MSYVHDHFDGSEHCLECRGPCRLRGPELVATGLARLIVESCASRRVDLNHLERAALERAGARPDMMLARARVWLEIEDV